MIKKKLFKTGDKVQINKPGFTLHGEHGSVTDLFQWSHHAYGVDVEGAGILRFYEYELVPVS